MDKTTTSLLRRIESSFSIEKHEAQPMALLHEIQFQLGCSYGAALNHTNEIALRLRKNG